MTDEALCGSIAQALESSAAIPAVALRSEVELLYVLPFNITSRDVSFGFNMRFPSQQRQLILYEVPLFRLRNINEMMENSQEVLARQALLALSEQAYDTIRTSVDYRRWLRLSMPRPHVGFPTTAESENEDRGQNEAAISRVANDMHDERERLKRDALEKTASVLERQKEARDNAEEVRVNNLRGMRRIRHNLHK